jgi:fluoride exporter
MLAYLWIAMGGALGSVARYWFSGVVGRQFGETFPWGTLLVNVSGSFVIGLLAALAEPGGRRFIGPTGRQFLMYGICGGYTTFSSFSLQTLELAREGDWLKAGANAAGSVLLCMVAVWLGYALGASFNTGKGN